MYQCVLQSYFVLYRLVKLPTHIGNLKNLKELHLRNNNLRVFPFLIKSLNLYTFTGTYITLCNFSSRYLAQYNPVMKENQIIQLNYTPLASFPSLVELSARAVKLNKLNWQVGGIPQNLHGIIIMGVSIELSILDMLSHHHGTCTICGRPFFNFYSCRVSFHLVGVFYRLPLYEHCCSPHNQWSCDQYVINNSNV